ncbi:MAG: hypothetical protein AAFW84_34000 [Cyanobacteria bacterium J06635_15]
MQSLRTLATHCNFTLGAAVTKEPYFFTDPTYRQIHADHFNLYVPANAMKYRTRNACGVLRCLN